MGCVCWELRLAIPCFLLISLLQSRRSTSCCARGFRQTRANIWFRMIQFDLALPFAERHDDRVWDCLALLLNVPPHLTHARITASRLLSKGCVGLVSALRTRHAGHWASWADSLPMVKQCRSDVSQRFLTVWSVTQQRVSRRSGVVRVSSEPQDLSLCLGMPSQTAFDPRMLKLMSLSRRRVGRRRRFRVWSSTILALQCEVERALSRSHQGPLAPIVFVAFPTNRVTRIDALPFRMLLCRRLRLPMPLSSRTCRCSRLLDVFGHHRERCAQAGLLGRRGYGLKCVAAQVCREAGKWVSMNVMMRDFDIPGPHAAIDGRGLEVIVDGLPLFDGAHLALDTTMVSPIHRDGRAKRGTSARNGVVLQDARRKKDRTYQELNGAGGRARLVVLAAEVGGRWSVGGCRVPRPRSTTAHAKRGRVQSAWLRRWRSLLVCNATKAFALSLLDKRPPLGVGGDTPSGHEVTRECRFV